MESGRKGGWRRGEGGQRRMGLWKGRRRREGLKGGIGRKIVGGEVQGRARQFKVVDSAGVWWRVWGMGAGMEGSEWGM